MSKKNKIQEEWTGSFYLRTLVNTCLKCDQEFKVRIFWGCQDDLRMKRICPSCKLENKLVHKEDEDACEYTGISSLKNKHIGNNKLKTKQGF